MEIGPAYVKKGPPKRSGEDRAGVCYLPLTVSYTKSATLIAALTTPTTQAAIAMPETMIPNFIA